MSKSPDAFRTIAEVSDLLGTAPHVLRFWEQKFSQIRPLKRGGGRRYYRPEDIALIAGIQQMLRDDGLTIRGAQKRISSDGIGAVQALGRDWLENNGADVPPPTMADPAPPAAAAPEHPARRKPARPARSAADDSTLPLFPEMEAPAPKPAPPPPARPAPPATAIRAETGTDDALSRIAIALQRSEAMLPPGSAPANPGLAQRLTRLAQDLRALTGNG